jgi:mono/diheme cytochrome c family protein
MKLSAGGAILVFAFVLVSNARPDTYQAVAPELPPGVGKAIVQRACTTCHNTEMITRKHATPAEWSATVDEMVNRGAELSDEEIPTVSQYLAASFPAVSNSNAGAAPGTRNKTP